MSPLQTPDHMSQEFTESCLNDPTTFKSDMSRAMARTKARFLANGHSSSNSETKLLRETDTTIEPEDQKRDLQNEGRECCSKLQSANEKLRDELDSSHDHSRHQMMILNSQLHEVESMAKTWQDKCEKAEWKSQRDLVLTEDLRDEIAELHDRIHELVQPCTGCSAFSRENAELRAEDCALSEELKAAQQTVTELQEKRDAQAPMADLRRCIERQRYKSLQDSTDESWGMYAAEAAARKNVEEKYAQLRREKQDHNDEQDITIYQLKKTESHLQMIIRGLHSEIATRKQRINDQGPTITLEHELRLADCEERNGALEAELEANNAQLSDVLACNKKLQEHNNIIEARLRDAASCNTQLLDHIETLKACQSARETQQDLSRLILRDVEDISHTLTARAVPDRDIASRLSLIETQVDALDKWIEPVMSEQNAQITDVQTTLVSMNSKIEDLKQPPPC
ncbi:hypothetical protein OPT61_g8981 [Boeremia exigua]|uniref:Uncharacterized protein n=1 Tax=Boeremia exigua TaxID=749465 RepID=A0ACC2HW00_9PLEO|nr:hypothetical protein OPT61_g8981 [Boeremia exigua]